jgi:two-component system, OmpR family, sensor histidine kinase VicK
MTNNEKQVGDRSVRAHHTVGAKEAEPRSSRTTRRLATGTDELQLAAISDAVFVVDANEMIIDANVRAEMLVGYARAELVGRAIGTVIGGLDPTPMLASTEIGEGEHARFIPAMNGAKAFHRGGGTFLVDVLICPHHHGSVLAIVRPLDAASSGGFRDDDVIQIVHDLKSPLATIALESELLDASIEGLDHDSLCRAVQRILLNVGFLDRMIQDLLDLSAFDAGRFSLRRNPVEMRALIEGTLERVVASRERQRVFFEGDARIVVSVDGLRLERVIANLLENAFKYAPKHSGIVVHLSRTATSVCVAVVDAGPGIADADHKAIFDKYRRARAVGSVEGNGLGLYVAKRIIEAHGGRIGVERVRDAGSRFYFELPIE